MSSGYDKWGEKFDRRPFWTGTKLYVGIVAVVLVVAAVVSIAAFGFRTGTADIKGRGEAHQQRVSAQNRVFAQQHFQELFNAIEKDKANVGVAKDQLKSNPGDPVAQTNVAGARQVCNTDVADYNADARKYLLRDFKDAELPAHIALDDCR